MSEQLMSVRVQPNTYTLTLIAVLVLCVTCSAQSTPTSIFPTSPIHDDSRVKLAVISCSSQGSQQLQDGVGGVPHGMQLLHCGVTNPTSHPITLTVTLITQAAAFAGFLILDHNLAAQTLLAPSKRGVWPALGRATENFLLPTATATLAAVGVDKKYVISTAGLALLTGYLRSVKDAHTVDPMQTINSIVTESDSGGHPTYITLDPSGSWSRNIGALFRSRHMGVIVDLFTDYSMSIRGTFTEQ